MHTASPFSPGPCPRPLRRLSRAVAHSLLGLFFAGALGLPHAGAAKAEIKPTLLSPDAAPGVIGALRLAASDHKEWELGNRPDRTFLLGYDFKGTLSTAPRYNPETSSIDALASLHWDLASVLAPPDEFKPPGANDSGAAATGGAFSPPASGFDSGSFEVELRAGYETDEARDNTQSSGGIRLNYSPGRNKWFLPHLWVDYRRVHELGSKVNTKLGIPEQNYWRLGAMAYWQIPLTDLLGENSFTRRFKLEPGLRYYRNTDAALLLKQADLDESHLYSFAVDYTLPSQASLSRWISGIRAGVAHGRIPPATKIQTTWSLAIDVRWDKFFD